MQRTVFDYVMYNERLSQDFECFHVHSPWNNSLVKFRDVEFEDACILFYFCSVLIN